MDINTQLIRYRRWFIIVPLAITVLMLLPLTKARINPDLMEYLPDDIEAKVNIDRLEKTFGFYEPIAIFLKAEDVLNEATLERIKNLTDEFKGMEEFRDVISLFETKYIRGEDGYMLVDPAVKRIPTSESRREMLRAEIIENPLAYKLLVSEEFNYSLIIINPNRGVPDPQIFSIIDQALEKFPGEEKVYINGLSYLRNEIQAIGIRDLAILIPLGLIVMLIFLYISFRERRGVLLPFAVVAMSIALAMGLMPILGYDLSLIAVLVPIMMIAIANNYGVHIVARYQEINARNPNRSMKEIVTEVVTMLTKPIILTGLTTIIGVMGLIVHIMLPAKQMGIVSAIGIAFALALSLLFVPAIMVGMNKGKPLPIFTREKHGWVDRFLTWGGRVATKSSMTVIYVFVSLLIIAGLGINRLQVSVNLENMMPASHPLQISTQIANSKFGGTKNISVLFEGDIKDPALMKTMDGFEEELKTLPQVGSVTSLASVIRIISRSLNDPGDELYDVIPNNRDAIAQYIEFYSMSGDPGDFEQMVDFDYTKAVLNVQFRADDIDDLKQVESHIQRLVDSTPFSNLMAGQCLIEKEMAQSIVRGQVYSLIFALVAIAILLWIIFRALSAGLMGSIPLFVTLICNFGLMGWFGIKLDIATSLLSSIAIGIGVDYTIHLFWRLKHELSLGNNYSTAIKNTLTTTGRGIAINGFSVILGFAVLFFSGLMILKTFAFLIIFSILLCLLCALILVPSLVMKVKPKFLEKNGKQAVLSGISQDYSQNKTA